MSVQIRRAAQRKKENLIKLNFMSNQNQQQFQVKASDEALKGHYANAMQVAHAKEEFVLDFFLLRPPAGQLLSRIVVSPSHFKRMIAALADNLKRYESQFGKVQEGEAPAGQAEIGFTA